MEMLLPHLGRHCRFAVLDGNNRSWLARFVPSRKRAVWSPEEFRAALARAGFTIVSHRGAIALVPLSWWLLPRSLARRVDTVLRGNWFFPFSHQILAVRDGR